MSSFRKMVCPPSVLHREIRPPIPRSKPTICAVTRGNIAELAATTFVALIIALLSVRTIEYTGAQRGGGESVSQSPLKDRAFLFFLDQNPPFELRPKTGVSPPIFSWNPSRLIQILANPSISVGGGQQGWSAFTLRRQRSHVRIVSGAPVFSYFTPRYERSD